VDEHDALRAWLELEIEEWIRAFVAALDDAIQHLQVLIFEEGWDALVAEMGSDEDALRESVRHYERGLARLFGFVRGSGAVSDAVAWSTMKTEYRRAALEADVEITLRTALESGMYAAEQIPLGDHGLYRAWAQALMLFLYQQAADATTHPGPSAPIEEQIGWAYGLLQPLEDHETFHRALVDYLYDADVEPVARVVLGRPPEAIIDLEARLLPLPRFDLILNTSLLWLAGAGARHPIEP
jgi:hypothetical protein